MPFLTGICIEFLFYFVITKDYNSYVENHFYIQHKNRISLCMLNYSLLKWKAICCNIKAEKKT